MMVANTKARLNPARVSSLTRLLLLLGFAVLGWVNSAYSADAAHQNTVSYPTRPMRFIAPTSAGGANDVLARLLAVRMTLNWGQQVVVDVRPGAGGIVGSELAARAAPDGYTLLIVANGYALNPFLYTKLPYDTLKDFERVSLFAVAPLVLVVHPSVPAQSLQELVALLKAKPGQLNYASSGAGSGGWLSAQLFRRMTGLDMAHVPYKGAGQATTAVVSGEVQLLFTSSLPAAPHVKAGRIRALGVTSGKRVSTMENVPAIGEVLPGYEVLNFFGLLVTGRTPKPIVARLHQEVARITALPELKSQLGALGFEVVDYGPEQFTAYVKSEMSKWSKVFAEIGIKPDALQ
jgi:tripartite-type tricarboxylate transporter receptor subunit TctC